MTHLLDLPAFAERYRGLAQVSLNPRRHTAANAHAHSEAVAARARRLAEANGFTASEADLLESLGRAHDIGKLTGTARPERSLDVLAECGVTDPTFLALVRWHDVSLPWWQSAQRGQPAGDGAWRRLAAAVDLRLLCVFAVADRVDAPAGWRGNPPTPWFLGEARRRGLIGELVVDLPGIPSLVSAGGAVVTDDGRVLVIRTASTGWELPKGRVEWDETIDDTAARETREEAGVAGELTADGRLGHVDYEIEQGSARFTKRVYYVRLRGAVDAGPLPPATLERAWLGAAEVATAPLAHESLRAILVAAVA